MAGRVGSWAPFPGPCVPWGSFPSRVPAAWTGLVADKDFPFGVCPFLISPSPPNPTCWFPPPPLSPPWTPLLPFWSPPTACPLSVCHPCPSPPPRPPADHLQQPGCHQDRGPGSGPPLPGPGVRPLLQWAQGAGAGRRERPQRADRGPPAPGGGGAVRAAQRGDHGYHPAGRHGHHHHGDHHHHGHHHHTPGPLPHAEGQHHPGEGPFSGWMRDGGSGGGMADVCLATPAPRKL